MQKRLAPILLTLSAVLLPLTAVAASIVTSDTIAGIGTQIGIQNLVPNTKVDVVVFPPTGPEIVEPVQADASGTATLRINGSDTQEAGTYEVQLEQNGTTLDGFGIFEVLPDSFHAQSSSIEVSKTTLVPDAKDSVAVVVILRDQFGNALSGRPMQLVSSRAGDSIRVLTKETDKYGEQQFSLSTTESGIISLRAMDLLSGKLLDSVVQIQAGIPQGTGGYYDQYSQPAPAPQYYNSYQQPAYYDTRYMAPAPAPTTFYPSAQYGENRFVGQLLGQNLYGQAGSFDIIDHFEIQAPAQMRTNEDSSISIRAVDRDGRKVEDYTGTALLSSTDEYAFLPLNGQVKFLPQNLGEKILTLGLRFRTPGEHILFIEDSTNPEVNGQMIIVVTGDGIDTTSEQIKITSHEQDSYISATTITIEGNGPPFLNLVVTGGKKDVIGETNDKGSFSIEVPLNETQVDHTIRVRDDSGRYDSGNLRLKYDNEPPIVGTITFAPEKPVSGDNVLLVIEADQGLGSLSLNLAGEVHELEEERTASGTYKLLFTAPAAGVYQPVIVAKDRAGNEVEVRANLTVQAEGLQSVSTLRATPAVNAVDLEWDAIDSEPVDAYRIYVGESKDDFLYTLDTDRPTTSATVAGLRPGKQYYFSVTGLKDDRESILKSDTVSAVVLGVDLSITPQENALLIEWGSLDEEVPLSTFLLEYGVEAEQFTEQRTLNGDLRAFALRDLIAGVTYYIRLTPVTTTGNVLRDMAVLGQGTPLGEGGFHPAPTEQPPIIPGTGYQNPPTGSQNPHPPQTPSTGIPFSGWWFAMALSGVLLAIHWKRRTMVTKTDAFLAMMEDRYTS